jgi:predicted metalloprotease
MPEPREADGPLDAVTGPALSRPETGALPGPADDQAFPDYPAGHGHQGFAASGPPQGPPGHWATAPPRAFADQPPPARPPRRSWVGAAIALVCLVVLGLAASLALPWLTHLQAPGRAATAAPTRSSATSKAGTTPSSGATPTATMPSDPATVLKKNPVYALRVPASCPAQKIPASAAAFRSQVKALVACENAAWKKALAATPVAFSAPKVRFYGASTRSPCGKLGSTYPAAYCTSDHTLYFSTASYRQGRYYRLAVAQFVMHEYAHHVQELAGIFTASSSMSEASSVTTRRIELQAHCMAHYQLTHAKISFSARDRADAEFQFGYTADPKGHGSTTAERYWGRRGLSASTIGACNTWSVKASVVK